MNSAPEALRFAAVAIDVVVFGVHEGKLCVLLAPVNRPPFYENREAFVGGLIEVQETADEAASWHLSQKAGLTKLYIEQLYTLSALQRDPRNRVISIAYLGLVPPSVVDTYTFADNRWCPVAKLPQLAYDHDEIAARALARLRGKLSYTTIVQYLLPPTFTLTELQQTYEIVLGRELDKRNFRKKILALDILKPTGDSQEGVKNRPAALYRFATPQVLELSPMV